MIHNHRHEHKRRQHRIRQLWDIHVALIREVTLSASMGSCNYKSTLETVYSNQQNLGFHFGEIINQRFENRYNGLLVSHINISVDIVHRLINGRSIDGEVRRLYQNFSDLACLFASHSSNINRQRLEELLFQYLESTLTEMKYVTNQQFRASISSNLCRYNDSRRIFNYILNNIY